MENKKHIAKLIAGFRGFKFTTLPIVFAHNNYNPKLILHEDYIEYRGGFCTGKTTYQEIEKIDIFVWKKGTNNIVISRKTSQFTFIGNFKNRTQLQDFLKIFYEKGCVLTQKALAEITPNNSVRTDK